MEIKLNDVYRFRYNEEWRKKIHDCNWCFDGQLIVRENSKGQLYLEDTYWGRSAENKSFTLEQALERGNLTFICNLDEVESIEPSELCYYDDEDLFDLSHQHNCYKDYYKRIGAEKSYKKMEQVLKARIQKFEHEIKNKESEINWYKDKLKKLQNGDMNIYI